MKLILKYVFFFVIFPLVNPQELNAQTSNVDFGPEIKKEIRSFGSVEPIGMIDNKPAFQNGHIYTIDNSKRISKINEENFKIPTTLLQADQDFYALYNKFKKEGKHYLIKFKKIDEEGNLIINKEVGRLDVDKTYGNYVKRYRISQSPNGRYIAYIHFYWYDEHKNNFLTNLFILDTKSDIVEHHIIGVKADLKSDYYGKEISSFVIDNKGNSLATVTTGSSDSDDRIRKDFLFGWDKNGNEILNKELVFDGIRLWNSKMKVDPKTGEIGIAGLFLSPNIENASYNGFFMGNINPSTFQFENIISQPFTEEILTFWDEDYPKNKSTNINGIFNAEFYFDNYSQDRFVIFEHYLDLEHDLYTALIIFSLDDENRLKSLNMIPKKQRLLFYKDAIGYKAFANKGTLHIVFNENTTNYEDEIPTLMDQVIVMQTRYKTSGTLHARIDKEGNLYRKILFNFDETDRFFFRTQSAYFEEGNKLKLHTIFSDKKKISKYGSIILE